MGRRPDGWKLTLDARSGIYGVRWRMDGKRYYVSTGARDPDEAARLAPHVFVDRVKRNRAQRPGRIYFVRAGTDGLVKIGFASHLPGRLASMRTDSPVELHLLASMPGLPSNERKLHSRFADLRERGEWFRADDDLLAFVQGIAAA